METIIRSWLVFWVALYEYFCEKRLSVKIRSKVQSLTEEFGSGSRQTTVSLKLNRLFKKKFSEF